MRKILWYSSINELDYEMQMLFDRHPAYEMRLAIPDADNQYFFPVNARIDDRGIETREQIVALLRSYQPDLLVHRYRREPTALLEAAEETGVPVLVWVTEQGPDRDIEWERNRHFRNLAANNPWDVHYFKNRGIENVYYWPFGCLPFFHRPVEPKPEFVADFVAYGNPIYNYYDSKRDSVDTVVRPLVEAGMNVAVWGRKTGPAGGWLDVPGVREGVHYKGTFNYDDLPAVNSSAKIVLGITSNGMYGAFGSRLARALAGRAFCIWAYSEGMEEMDEGFENHKNCCWSTHPEETLEIARFYLKNEQARLRVAEAGQRLAHEKLNLETIVPPIIEDVLANHPRRAHSRCFALTRDLRRASRESRAEDAIRAAYAVMAHDVTSLTHSDAVAMAEAQLAQGQYRLALGYLHRYAEMLAAVVRRLSRSPDQPELAVQLRRLYRAMFDTVGSLLAARSPEKTADAQAILRGLLDFADRHAAGDLLREVARWLSQHCYREGLSAQALRAFNLYTSLCVRPGLDANGLRALARDLAACVPESPETLAASASPASVAAAAGPATSSDWELFLGLARRAPLDRRHILLAGDTEALWGDYLAHNVGPTTRLAEGDAAAPSSNGGVGASETRAVARLCQQEADLRLSDHDALLYVALRADPQHVERLRRLVRGLPDGAAILVAGIGDGWPGSLETMGLRVGWHEAIDGLGELDYDRGHPCCGPLIRAGAWKGISSGERLLGLAAHLAARLKPRISHVTLDPLEILLGLYAFSDGYARVMEQVCRAEGLRTRAVTLMAPAEDGARFARPRRHTVLEIRTEDGWTTCDPMLGLAYDATVGDLLDDPLLAGRTRGTRSPHWDKFALGRYTGSEFFAGVTEVAARELVEDTAQPQPRRAVAVMA